MKKKILLLIAMLVMMCTLAISASAATAVPNFTDVIDVTKEGEGVISAIDTSSLGTVTMEDNTSRVLLKDQEGNYATYLSKYITVAKEVSDGEYGINLYFDALNVATGKGYSEASVVRLEIPEGIHRVYSISFKSCVSMITVKAPTTLWVNEPNAYDSCSCLKVIDYSQSNATELKTTATSIFANNSSVEEVRLPKNLVSMGKTAFHNDGSLKKVYIPSTFTTTTSIVNKGAPKCVFFYTGDIETAQSVFPKTLPTSYTITLEYVEWDSTKSDDYYVELAQNHSSAYVIYVVSNYNKCNAFHYGEHTESEENELCFTSYTEKMQEISACSRGCGVSTVVAEYAPIFDGVKYSVKENGTDLCASYCVDKNSLDLYNKYNSNATISYGLIASLTPGENEKLLSYENGELICNIQNAILVGMDSKYVGFDFILRGFNTETLEKTPLVICAYVVNGTDILYIGSDTTEEPTPVVMYDIKNSIS